MGEKNSRRIRLDWIPIDVSFPRGRKAVALGIATGNPLAWAHVVMLWTWAAENARDGKLVGPDAVGVIENAANWTGAPGDLVRCMALPHIRLLDELSSGFAIHDWDEHTGKHLVSAQANAERNAKKQAEWRSRNRVRNRPVTEECDAKKGKGKGITEEEAPSSGKPTPSPRFTPLRNKLVETFAACRGSEYAFGGAKDAAALKRLLGFTEDDSEVDRRWRRGLGLSKWPGVSTIAQLAERWNDLAPVVATQPVAMLRPLGPPGAM